MYNTQTTTRNQYDRKKTLDILIVDDDKSALKYFEKILQLRGHNVTIIDEGIRCVSKCLDNHYDIIFMDYHIDDITGDELTSIIKDDYSNNSKVFAYTGDKSKNAIESFKHSGMIGAMIKPVNIELFGEIMYILEKDCVELDVERLKRIARKSGGNVIVF